MSPACVSTCARLHTRSHAHTQTSQGTSVLHTFFYEIFLKQIFAFQRWGSQSRRSECKSLPFQSCSFHCTPVANERGFSSIHFPELLEADVSSVPSRSYHACRLKATLVKKRRECSQDCHCTNCTRGQWGCRCTNCTRGQRGCHCTNCTRGLLCSSMRTVIQCFRNFPQPTLLYSVFHITYLDPIHCLSLHMHPVPLHSPPK